MFDGIDLYRYILVCGVGDIYGYLFYCELFLNLCDWNDNYGEVYYFYDMFYGFVNL